MALITFFFRIKQVLIEKKIASEGRATLCYRQLMFSHFGTGECFLKLAVCIRIAALLSKLTNSPLVFLHRL